MTEMIPVSCLEYRCCFILVICPLLQCSASCGQGYRQRLISCSEVHVENENYEYGHQSLSNCPGMPPESYMPCHLDPCPLPQEWRVGIWGPVREPMVLNFVQSFFSFFFRMGHAWLHLGFLKLILLPNYVFIHYLHIFIEKRDICLDEDN